MRGPVSRNTAETVGLYAFDSIALGDQWVFNLGIRYDQYSVEGYDATGTNTAPVYTRREGDWDFVNYQAGLVYKPTRNSSLYASYSTSSTPPTIAGGDQNAGNGQGTGNLRQRPARAGRHHQLRDRRQAQPVPPAAPALGRRLQADPRERPDPDLRRRLRPGRRGRGPRHRARRLGQHHPQMAGLRRLYLHGLRTGPRRLQRHQPGRSPGQHARALASACSRPTTSPTASRPAAASTMSRPASAATRAAPAAGPTASMRRNTPAWTCSPPTTSPTARPCN